MMYHPEILTAKQTKTLTLLAPFVSQRDFYLAGGTALALYLGHRRSKDLDWFTSSRIADPIRLAGEIQQEDIPFTTGHVEKGTLYGTVFGVQVSLIEYHYPFLQPHTTLPDFNCSLASLQDIACMKLSAATQRATRKDFIDIYSLGEHVFALKDMLTMYRRKFDVKDIGHLLYALAYFDKADLEKMPVMLKKVDWKTVKRTVRSWVKELSKKE